MKCDYLAFVVSYRCNIECAHCCVESGPDRIDAPIPAATMIARVDEMAARAQLRRVAFTGGEPTLFPGSVLPVLRHCRSLALETRVTTNASWARTEEAAGSLAAEYAEAGLTEFAVSCSSYHLRFYGFDRYVRAVRASLGQGIQVQMLVLEDAASQIDVETVRRLLEGQVDLSDRRLSFESSEVVPVGRARHLAASHFRTMPLGAVPKAGCGMVLNPIVGTSEGRLMACCGFPYAEIEEIRIGTLGGGLTAALDRARRDPILRWIHAVGPWRILEIVHPERYHEGTPVAGGHICQGCNLLFSDAENRARLHDYVRRRGEDLLFAECLEPFERLGEASDRLLRAE